jgi:hypothetical protein
LRGWYQFDRFLHCSEIQSCFFMSMRFECLSLFQLSERSPLFLGAFHFGCDNVIYFQLAIQLFNSQFIQELHGQAMINNSIEWPLLILYSLSNLLFWTFFLLSFTSKFRKISELSLQLFHSLQISSFLQLQKASINHT